jgi:hypothetical protein
LGGLEFWKRTFSISAINGFLSLWRWFMRYVKLLATVLFTTMIATVVSAKACDPFGKGAPPFGATPRVISSSGGYVDSRQYGQPAAVIATGPATTGRRAFSADPAAAAAAVRATAVPANAPNDRTNYDRPLPQAQFKAMTRGLFYGGTDGNDPRVISGTAQ